MRQVKIRQEISKRLKEARIAAGYESIEDFCQKNELDLATYSKHENGLLTLKASQALRYCETLHISLQLLILGDDWRRLDLS